MAAVPVVAAKSNLPEENFTDVDPWAEQALGDTEAQGQQTRPTVGGGGAKERVLKMNSLIDQYDDSELLPPSASEVDRWYQNYIMTMGSQPDETEEPTANQLAALHKRVFVENRESTSLLLRLHSLGPAGKENEYSPEVQSFYPVRGWNLSSERSPWARNLFSLESVVQRFSHSLPDAEHLLHCRTGSLCQADRKVDSAMAENLGADLYSR